MFQPTFQQQLQSQPQPQFQEQSPQQPAIQVFGQSEHKIYVGDISDNFTESDLRSLFSQIGNIVQAKVIKIKNGSFGEVIFSDPMAVNRAILEVNLKLLPGATKPLRIMKYQPSLVKQSSNNVYIKNMNPLINLQDFWHQLLEFGNITSIKIGTNNNGGLLGYCYIQFEQKEDVQKCIQNIHQISLPQQTTPLIAELYVDKADRQKSRKNLYLKNLPDNLTEKELEQKIKEVFSPLGEIASSLVKKNTINGTVKPFAFVCFNSTESAAEAMETLNEKDVFGCGIPLYMNWAENRLERLRKIKEQQSQGSEKILYTKNIKLEVTAEKLKEAYSEIGEIDYCNVKEPDLPPQMQYKKMKFGYIFFKEKDFAKKAIIEAKNNDKILALYEDGKLYINNLLNKETFQRYKQQQRNKKQQFQEENKQDQLTQPMQAFMQIMSPVIQLFQNFLNQQNPQKPNQFQNNNNKPLRNQFSGFDPQQQPQFRSQQQQQYSRGAQNKQFQKRQQPPQQFQHQMQYPNFPPQQMMKQQMPQPSMPKMMPPQNQPFPQQQMPMMPQQQMLQQQMPQHMMPQQIQQIPQIPQMPFNQPPQQPPFLGQPPKFAPPMAMQQPQQQPMQQIIQPSQQIPQLMQQQQLQQQQQSSQFKSLNELKGRLSEFLALNSDEQRKILGEMLFPKVKELVDDQEIAPKITGMLIDFEVFEIQDILDILENQVALQEQIKEALDLINTQSQSQ